jgi:hypothetical protein
LFQQVLRDNLAGFVALQRVAEALDEIVRVDHAKIVENPHSARAIIDLLKTITVDPYYFDRNLPSSKKFIEHFHTESFNCTADTSHAKFFRKSKRLADVGIRNPGGVFTVDFKTSNFDSGLNVFDDFLIQNTNIRENLVVDLKENAYFAKTYTKADKEDELCFFPIQLCRADYTEVTTLALASADGKVTANNIREKFKEMKTNNVVNHYGGIRDFPAKTALPTGNAIIYAGEVFSLGYQALCDRQKEWEGADIDSSGFIPPSIKFLSEDDGMDMYMSAKMALSEAVGLNGASEEIGSLKNFMSVFDKITDAYNRDTNTQSRFAMNVGQIYEGIKIYIANTTMYPIIVEHDKTIHCPGIGLREFGKDAIYHEEDRTTFTSKFTNYNYHRMQTNSARSYHMGEVNFADNGSEETGMDLSKGDPFMAFDDSELAKFNPDPHPTNMSKKHFVL